MSSTNTGDTKGVAGVKAEEQKRLQYNPHLKQIDMRQHGYGVLEVTQDDARLSYRAVDKLLANAGVSTSYEVRAARHLHGRGDLIGQCHHWKPQQPLSV